MKQFLFLLPIIFSSILAAQNNQISCADIQFRSVTNSLPFDVHKGVLTGNNSYSTNFDALISELPTIMRQQINMRIDWVKGNVQTSNEKVNFLFQVSDEVIFNAQFENTLAELFWKGTKSFKGQTIQFNDIRTRSLHTRKWGIGFQYFLNDNIYFSVLPYLGQGFQFIDTKSTYVRMEFADNGEYLKLSSNIEIEMSNPAQSNAEGLGLGIDLGFGLQYEYAQIEAAIQNIGFLYYQYAQKRVAVNENVVFDGIDLLDPNSIEMLESLLGFQKYTRKQQIQTPINFALHSHFSFTSMFQLEVDMHHFLQRKYRISYLPFIQFKPMFGKTNRFQVYPIFGVQDGIGSSLGAGITFGGNHFSISPQIGGIQLGNQPASQIIGNINLKFYW